MASTLLINLVAILTVVLGICCVLALFSQAFRVLLASIFAVFIRPLSRIQEALTSSLRAVTSWLRQQAEEESTRKEQGPVYFLIGALLYSILTAIFILCDFRMIVLTFQAMGMDEPGFSLPIDASTLTAATLVTSALFWGAVLFDLLGVTHLAPWRKTLPAIVRKLFIGLSVLLISVAIFIGASMAYWRGESLNQIVPEAEAAQTDPSVLLQPSIDTTNLGGQQLGSLETDLSDDQDLPILDSGSRWIVPASLVGVAGLSLISSAFSMVGLAIMVKFVILLVIFASALSVMPLGFAAWLISTLLEGIFQIVQLAMDLLIGIGTSFLGIFGWRPSGEVSVPAVENQSPPYGPEQSSPPQQSGGIDTMEETGVDPGFNPFGAR